MDESRLQAYVNLIEHLLACVDEEEFNNILQASQELIDPEFLQVMENYATGLEQQGNNNPAAWLRDMAQQLGQYLNPQAESMEEYQEFLLEVLQAEYDSNSDPAVVYPILQRRQHLLDDTFAQVLQQYARNAFSQGKPEEVAGIAVVIQNLCLDISEFPLGSQANNLEIVIIGYQTVLEVYTRDAFPEDWAMTQNNLGNAYLYRIRGERLENLELAIKALNLSSEVYTREAFPEDWAMTQNNLGNAYLLRIKGKRADNLELAITAYNISLEVYTRDIFPYEWASSHNNLGNAYGDRIKGARADNLELAITAYKLSLEVYIREAFPHEWASSQNNLGEAYRSRIRGERADNLELAIAALNLSLEVYIREDFPYGWARSQNNLGIAYLDRIKGERVDNLELAITALSLSLEIRTRDAFPEDWATTQNNLGAAYRNRIKGDIAENIENAIFCYQESLKIRTFDAFPLDWATTQNNLGNAYSNRIRGNKAENIENAITCHQNALQIYTCEAFPEDWAETQYNLANTFRERFKLLGKLEDIQQAIAVYKRGREIIEKTEDQELYFNYSYQLGKALFEGGYYAEAIEHLENCQHSYQKQKNISSLAPILLELARLYHRTGRLEQARLYFKDSLRLFRRLGDRDNMASVISALGNLEIQIGKIPQACSHLKEAQEYYQENNNTERLDEINHLLKILQSA